MARQALILPVKIADLAPADADIPRRNVDVGPDMAIQLRHKALAKAHDFPVGFSFRIKIGAAFPAADGEPRERVFQYLLRRQEL